MQFDDLVERLLKEAKEAPKGKHYTSRGSLKSGDADADGDGGPKYRSDPTYKNPNEDNEHNEEDAEGRIDKDRMKCNSPRRTSGGSKKFVVKACKNGKEKVVRYGDPNMKIKKSNPKRRKSFRARHKCDQKKDKLTAGYWSCKKW